MRWAVDTTIQCSIIMYRRYSEGEGWFREHPRCSLQQEDAPQLQAIEPQQHAPKSLWDISAVAIKEAGQIVKELPSCYKLDNVGTVRQQAKLLS